MKTIYRTRKNAENIPRDKQVVYLEDWWTVAAIAAVLSFVALMWLSLKAGELVGYGQHTWPAWLKDALLYLNLTLSALAGWRAAAGLVKPQKLKQTRGAVLHEDDRIGGDGFQAMKLFLDDELKSQPGKAPPLVLAVPKGLQALDIVNPYWPNKKRPWTAPKTKFEACIPLPDSRSSRHILMVGGTRSGKSVTLKNLFHQTVNRGEKSIVLDKKGEYTAELRPGSFALVGVHDIRQVELVPGKDIRTNAHALQFFKGVIPIKESDSFWGTAAIQICVGVCVYLINTKPQKWTWYDFTQVLTKSNQEIIEIIRTHYPAALKMVDGAENTVASVFGNLAAYIDPFFTFAKEWNDSAYEKLSIQDWLEESNSKFQHIVFCSGGEFSEQNEPLFRGYLNLITSRIDGPQYLQAQSRNYRPLWIFCDEFQSFGKLDKFVYPLLERGAGAGARLCIGVQDISQLKEVYGEHFVSTLMSNAGLTMLAGANWGQTAETYAKSFGDMSFNKIHRRDSGDMSTRDEQEHTEQLIITADIVEKLGFKNGTTRVLYAYSLNKEAYIVYQPLVQYPQLSPFVVMTDWAKGIASPAQKAQETQSTTTQRSQEPAPQQLRSEELPEELDDLPPGYEDFPELDDEEDPDLYYHPHPEADELAAPVASLAGVSGIEHAISIIDLLSNEKPKLKASKSIEEVRAEVKKEIETLTLRNNMLR